MIVDRSLQFLDSLSDGLSLISLVYVETSLNFLLNESLNPGFLTFHQLTSLLVCFEDHALSLSVNMLDLLVVYACIRK